MAFPNLAQAGLTWWQIDLGTGVIWIMGKLGLAWNIKRPNRKIIEEKLEGKFLKKAFARE